MLIDQTTTLLGEQVLHAKAAVKINSIDFIFGALVIDFVHYGQKHVNYSVIAMFVL